jgi:tRNA threonylcarbamoyl adenosine modification protein YeaZ
VTVVLSTSSPVASVAILSELGQVLSHGEQESHQRASGALMFLLENCLKGAEKSLEDVRLFVADVGPGSFTGVRVGVTMAKTMAFAQMVPAAAVSAFDLIDPERAVAIPSRKGEWFVRVPGSLPLVTKHLPDGVVGYGVDATLPVARNADRLVASLVPMSPELLVPTYVAEPSISKPRDPKIMGGPSA